MQLKTRKYWYTCNVACSTATQIESMPCMPDTPLSVTLLPSSVLIGNPGYQYFEERSWYGDMCSEWRVTGNFQSCVAAVDGICAAYPLIFHAETHKLEGLVKFCDPTYKHWLVAADLATPLLHIAPCLTLQCSFRTRFYFILFSLPCVLLRLIQWDPTLMWCETCISMLLCAVIYYILYNVMMPQHFSHQSCEPILKSSKCMFFFSLSLLLKRDNRKCQQNCGQVPHTSHTSFVTSLKAIIFFFFRDYVSYHIRACWQGTQ